MANGVWSFKYREGGRLAIPVIDGEPSARVFDSGVAFEYTDGRMTVVPLFNVDEMNYNPEKE